LRALSRGIANIVVEPEGAAQARINNAIQLPIRRANSVVKRSAAGLHVSRALDRGVEWASRADIIAKVTGADIDCTSGLVGNLDVAIIAGVRLARSNGDSLALVSAFHLSASSRGIISERSAVLLLRAIRAAV